MFSFVEWTRRAGKNMRVPLLGLTKSIYYKISKDVYLKILNVRLKIPNFAYVYCMC